MIVTIIPIDGFVKVNFKSYSPLTWEGTPENVHALQWQTSKGWVEFNDGTPNQEIVVLPSWADNAITAWQVASENDVEPIRSKEENKANAKFFLQSTDWVCINDIDNPSISSPYLLNKDDFIVYRNTLRQFILNPQEGIIEFMEKPKAIWSNS
jgi:nitrogen regulatory protein PII-like uncharacterized protein